MSDISHFKIPIYDFPVDPNEDDDETIEENNECRSMLPFSVIGMEHDVKVGGTCQFQRRNLRLTHVR